MSSRSDEERDSAFALAATHWAALVAVAVLGVALVFLAPSASRSAENDSIESAEPIDSLPHRTEGIDLQTATADADDPTTFVRPAETDPLVCADARRRHADVRPRRAGGGHRGLRRPDDRRLAQGTRR